MPTFLLIFCVDFPSFCARNSKRKKTPNSGKYRDCRTCFGGTEQGASCPPVPPRQGHRPWTQSAKWLCVKTSCFRVKLGERKSAPTGAMKTEKRRGWKQVSSSAFFAVFPGCFASGWRRDAAGPWCGSAQPTRNMTSVLLKLGLCVLQIIPRLLREIACLSSQSLPQLGQGTKSLVGCRGNAPQVILYCKEKSCMSASCSRKLITARSAHAGRLPWCFPGY